VATAPTVIQNRDRSPLTTEQLQRVVPSIFAEAPHESRSDRYLYVPTVQMLDVLQGEGFRPVWASQSRTRDASRREFTKHMIRLALTDRDDILQNLRDTIGNSHTILARTQSPVFPEIVLTNSHDGSSSVQLSAGLFRYACTNGLIVSEGSAESYRFNHSNKWRDQIIEGTYRVIDAMEPVTEQVGEMQARELSQPERLLLAETAASLRWHGEQPPIRPEQLLSTRRRDDSSHDAFTTLNVLQENVIRGGIGYVHRDQNNRAQYRHTRPVNGLDDLGRLNRGIWDAVATLTSPNRLDLAREMFGRLTPEERAQLALQFA